MVDALDDRSGTLFLPTTFVVAFAFAVVIFVFAIVIMPAIMAMIAMYLAQLRSAAVTAVVLGDRAFRRRKQQRPRCQRCNKCECGNYLDSAHSGSPFTLSLRALPKCRSSHRPSHRRYIFKSNYACCIVDVFAVFELNSH
jgi:hypothetical protein